MIARAYRSYVGRKNAKEGVYSVTLYWNEPYSEKKEVRVYGNFTTPPWKVLIFFKQLVLIGI